MGKWGQAPSTTWPFGRRTRKPRRSGGSGSRTWGSTPPPDRQYFRSVYFREPGGVLFELATDPPGFTLDESVEEMGSGLKLPGWLEPHRDGIERNLPRVTVPDAVPA